MFYCRRPEGKRSASPRYNSYSFPDLFTTNNTVNKSLKRSFFTTIPATPPVATRASGQVQTSAPSAIRSAPMHTRSTVSASRAAPTVSSPTRTVCANRARPRAKPALDHAPHSALAACRTAALQALARQTSSRSCSSRRLRKSPRLALV